MALDIDTIGAEPVREVPTSRGPLFVYAITKANLGDVGSFEALDLQTRGRELFQRLVSQVRRARHSEGPPKPLPPVVLEALSPAEVQGVTDALREALAKYRARQESGRGLGETDPLREGESPYVYFARLVEDELRRDDAQMRAIRDKALEGLGGSVRRAFRALEAQDGSLGSKVRELERLHTRTLEVDTGMIRHQQQMARQHAEDRERVRLTAETTAESAKLLRQLVAAAESFMAGVAQRDEEEKAKFKAQIWLGVFSLLASAVLSAVALLYAVRSYEHDLARDASDDAAARATAAREERITKAIEQNAALHQRNAEIAQEQRSLIARQPASSVSSGRR